MGPTLAVTWLLLLSVCPAQTEYIADAWTETRQGQLLGRRRREHYAIGKGAITHTVDEYLGVPYAAPPVGEYRFQKPREVGGWQGLLNCSKAGWVCPQVPYYSQTAYNRQNEDCLTLNIYVPVVSIPSNPWPSMVFIHGGSYEEGAGIRYDGFSLATHGTIVVTINYRLAAMGFLTTGDERLPGNYGLWDQVEALRWLKANLPYFHGDPDRITLFGSSAGSSSIGLLMLSPKTKYLFQSVILQSGSPLSSWAVYNETVDHSSFVRHVAQRVGCTESRMNDIIDCLRYKPHRTISERHWEFPRIVPSKMNFKPVLDGDLLPASPEELVTSRDFRPVPAMMGVVQDEWARSLGWFFKDLNSTDPDHNFVDGLDRKAFEESVHYVITSRFWWPPSLSDVIVYAYTDWQNKSHPILNRQRYLELTSDLLMVAPAVRLATILAEKMSGRHGFFYLIDIPEAHVRHTWWSHLTYHSVELDYVFGSPFNGYNIGEDSHANHSEAERNISRRLMSLWTNFAKHGHPTPHEDNTLHEWMEYESKNQNYYYIGTNSSHMRHSLRAGKMHFWNHLIPSLYRELHRLQALAFANSHTDCNLLCWIFVSLTFTLVLLLVLTLYKLWSVKKRLKHVGYTVTPQDV